MPHWLRLLAALPLWLASPTSPPAALVHVATAFKRQAMLHAVALFSAATAAGLVGVSIMLWWVLPTLPRHAEWALALTPLTPFLLAVGCWWAAQTPQAEKHHPKPTTAPAPPGDASTVPAWRDAGQQMLTDTNLALRPLAQRHPLALVAGAVALGAALVLLRPTWLLRARQSKMMQRAAAPPASAASVWLPMLMPVLLPLLQPLLMRVADTLRGEPEGPVQPSARRSKNA